MYEENINNASAFEFVAGGSDKRILTGKEKAAILMGELSGYSSDVLKYLKTDEIRAIRKSMKKLGKRIEQNREIKTLEEVNKFGISRRINTARPELFDKELYRTEKENKKSREYLHGLFKNPDAVANVISVWLGED